MGERRIPVQADYPGKPPGTVSWSTHLAAWRGYAAVGFGDQSAEQVAERGGFGYRELQCAIAGHYGQLVRGRCPIHHPEPAGWKPRG